MQAENQQPSPEEIKKNCIFCKITNDEIESKKIGSSDNFIAILDVNPATPGHTLILPKEHIAVFPLAGPEIAGELGKFVKEISQKILQSLEVEGTSIYIGSGAAAGQQSPHAVAHILPRKAGDDAGMQPETQEIAEQTEIIKKIGAQLGIQNIEDEQLVQDEELTALVPVHASAAGEINIIPNEKFTIIEQAPDELIAKSFQIAMKLKSTLFDALQPAGTSMLIQNGIPAGQTEDRFKIRLIPRHENDSLDLAIKNNKIDPQRLAEIHGSFVNTIDYNSSSDNNETPTSDNIQHTKELDDEDDHLIKALKRRV